MTTYEGAIERISSLVPASSENERLVDWIDDEGDVGVARTTGGRVELFFVGPELEVTYKSVEDQLVYRQFFRKDGGPFTASRLELPLAGHFDQVAAFICAELIRNGSSADIAAAFTASEPVIDLALETLHASDSWLRGLVAELALLNAMVQQVRPAAVPLVLDCWSGYQPSLRDFNLEDVGVEVKATARNASTHAINGLYQVERQADEKNLYLTSFVGLAWQPEGDSTVLTARGLIERIIARIAETGQPETLADRLRFQASEYLPKSANGPEPLDRPFKWTAVRSYDLSDPAIQLVGSDDVAKRPNTVLATVRFDIELPDQVTGDLNPTVGLNRSAAVILQKAGVGTATLY